ncbi:MAG: Holliday junction resolvase RuvX [Patescibacteria group bacterium]
MKYLGIDYGTKRIGIAVSDEGGSVAFPLSTVDAGPGALSQVAALVKENGVQKVVIGESRNFAGQPNEVQEDIEQFKKDIAELSALPVEYEREFFTSALAARQFAPDGSRKENPSQAKLDASAAALILQSYLDRIKGKIKTNGATGK